MVPSALIAVPPARRTAHGRWIAPAIAVVLAGCSAYEPVDADRYVAERALERVPAELAAEVALPYELDEAVRAEVTGRLSPAGSETRRTDEILDFIFGWLDLQYALAPTRNASQTFRAREGNCLSFVNLFVGVARLQRLNPFYVEVKDYQRWNFRDGSVVSRGHIVAGLTVDGKLSTFDFLPYRPKSYRDFQPIDDLAAMAHFYNNLGAEALMEGDIESAERNLQVATALAPDFDKAINNLGVCYLRRGEASRAVELYERALEKSPENVALLTNQARAYQELGREEEAGRLLMLLEQVNETNPFFYVYRGEAALAAGDTAKALQYMRRALQVDSETPEVHIGLIKVYLAQGEMDKARHHLERALRLDATHQEARELAAMLSMGEEAVAPVDP